MLPAALKLIILIESFSTIQINEEAGVNFGRIINSGNSSELASTT